MGGSSEWDNRMMDSLKNFDLSSPEVKQQFGKCLIEMPIRFVNLSVFFFWQYQFILGVFMFITFEF